MIDGSEKRNRQLAVELQNSHVCEKSSNSSTLIKWMGFVRLQITLSSVSANILYNLRVSNSLFIFILFTTCYHNVFRFAHHIQSETFLRLSFELTCLQ